PIALRARHGLVDLAMGIAAVADAEASLHTVTLAIQATPMLAEAIASAQTGRPMAILCTHEAARVLASA
ncbi:MAG: hypothetical protein ACREJ3_17405, partial [Polyangiaceae bacterium]